MKRMIIIVGAGGGGMGTKIVFRNQGAAGLRWTWLHSGAGENWTRKTEGCIRGRDSDMSWLAGLYKLNKGNGNRHRVTVGPRGSRKLGKGVGGAIGNAFRGPSVRLPVIHPHKGLLR